MIDNINVEQIPEPSTGLLALLGAAFALRRRR
ncbi:MAG: PEP-CTERM sorting domain-containing protein [Akkermansiaceae bacterium]|nr:PEP-CTERM sorting domain-containing protein [Akkermansiaceae bacterium]